MNWKTLLDFTVGFVAVIIALTVACLVLWIVIDVLQPPWSFFFVVVVIAVIGGVLYARREQE